jgi:hypothetical protein
MSGVNLKDYFKIEFIDQNNMLEPGVDNGGLFKEFLTEITK